MSKKPRFVKVVIAAIVAFSSVGFVSCVDDDKNLYNDDGTSELNGFDFSTKKNVEINLSYKVSSDYRVNFEMYTKSPIVLDEFKSYVKDSTLVPFLSGRSDKGGKIHFKGELPSSVSEIYAYSYGIGTPVLMKASVSNAGVVSAFQEIKVPAVSSSRATQNASGTSSWKTYNVTLNTQKNLNSVSRKITDLDKELIDKSFSVDQNYDLEKSYYYPYIELKGDATVKIYSVQNGANSDRTNALAYFVHKKNETVNPEGANLDLVFPELNKKIPAEGQGYQLLNKEGDEMFKAGSCISFALFPDIDPENIVTKDAHVLYSCFETGTWNTYSYPGFNGDKGLYRASVPHMVISLLRTTDEGHAILAIGFEDQPWSTSYGTNRGDFRDDIFILEIDPKTSLPDDLPTPPTDEPTYDMEFAETGILCFEDCWPAKGDYDINDVVVSYERTIYMKNFSVAALKEKYTFLNNGASYVNGFGYQLSGSKYSDVKECKVESEYTFTGQGLDKTSDEAIVMLFDDSKNLKAGVTTFTVSTLMNNGALVTGINPFIVTKGDFSPNLDVLAKGRIEVHLPTPFNALNKYLPTSKANTGYFGTLDDKSIPTSKVYYVRAGNYPFSLDIKWDSSKHGEVNKFIIPTEGQKIEVTYPEFTEWVKSNGKNNTDWYLHPNR